jgi:hypothetical protein
MWNTQNMSFQHCIVTQGRQHGNILVWCPTKLEWQCRIYLHGSSSVNISLSPETWSFWTWIWQLTRPVSTQLYYFRTWPWTAPTAKHTYANHPAWENYIEAERMPIMEQVFQPTIQILLNGKHKQPYPKHSIHLSTTILKPYPTQHVYKMNVITYLKILTYQ